MLRKNRDERLGLFWELSAEIQLVNIGNMKSFSMANYIISHSDMLFFIFSNKQAAPRLKRYICTRLLYRNLFCTVNRVLYHIMDFTLDIFSCGLASIASLFIYIYTHTHIFIFIYYYQWYLSATFYKLFFYQHVLCLEKIFVMSFSHV